MFENRGIMGN